MPSSNKSEAQIVEEIRRACISLDVIPFKNAVGCVKIEGRFIEYGLQKGSSDLIGIQRVLITPDMVGKHVGVFCAIEVKKSNWKPSMDTQKHHAEQKNFIDQIKKMGGKGGFYTNSADFVDDMNCTQ